MVHPFAEVAGRLGPRFSAADTELVGRILPTAAAAPVTVADLRMLRRVMR
jgi:hypothetical protein